MAWRWPMVRFHGTRHVGDPVTGTPSSSSDITEFLLHQIRRAKELRAAHEARPGGVAQRLLLRQWQAARLARTHEDLLNDTEYHAAAEFFLSDLYGLRDTSERDAELERIYPTMVKLLPVTALHTVGLAVELDALSEDLDTQLLDVLFGQLGIRDEISEAAYVEAYRRCDNIALRRHQIELVRQVGDDLAQLVGKPMVYMVLHAMRAPARMAGFGELQEFLERGFSAFRKLTDPRPFLDTIQRRETQILERIYAGHPRPFDLDEPQPAA